jgi:hypothetical protein
MDVAAIEVGTDFVAQMEGAISTGDASLVVIGPNWLGATDADGRRRLDDPDDHVRSEVRAALGSSKPVVPVLVGGASLPSEDDLPDDIAALARRQAVELRDQTWVEDVETLVRRLEGKDVGVTGRRFLPWAIGLAVLVAGGAVVWNALADGDGSETPTCEPVANAERTVIEVAPGAAEVDESNSRLLDFRVTGAEATTAGSEWLIVLDVEVFNETTEAGNQEGHYYGLSDFEALLVDGFANEPMCFSPIAGNRDDLTPEERASALIGFQSITDPTGAELVLELSGGPRIQITPDV